MKAGFECVMQILKQHLSQQSISLYSHCEFPVLIETPFNSIIMTLYSIGRDSEHFPPSAKPCLISACHLENEKRHRQVFFFLLKEIVNTVYGSISECLTTEMDIFSLKTKMLNNFKSTVCKSIVVFSTLWLKTHKN